MNLKKKSLHLKESSNSIFATKNEIQSTHDDKTGWNIIGSDRIRLLIPISRHIVEWTTTKIPKKNYKVGNKKSKQKWLGRSLTNNLKF